VFLAGTKTLLGRPTDLAAYIAERPDAVVAVSNRALPGFLRACFQRLELPVPLSQVRVFNSSNGIWEDITFFAGAAR
jgi:hypothetical protein